MYTNDALTLDEEADQYSLYKGNIYRRAFTLAEVLVTLGILGVVAALTIPSLTNKVPDQKHMAALKKTYSVLQQATNLVIAEHESPAYWWIEDSLEEPVKIIYNYYKPYFNAMRECPNVPGCWAYPTKYLNGSVYWDAHNISWYQYAYTLADGVNILIDIYDTANARSFGVDVDYPCPIIWVDVNADALPNQIGRDMFAFVITHEGLKPAGLDDVSDCTTSGKGWTCVSRIIRDGWTIKYLE